MRGTAHDVLGAVALTLLGHGVGGLSVCAFGPPAGDTLLPPLAFALAWTVLYPTLAIGARRAGGGEGLGSALCALAIVVGWMPVACAAQQPWATLAMDVVAWAIVWVAAWAQAPRSRSWFLPAAAWMPITTSLSAIAALQST